MRWGRMVGILMMLGLMTGCDVVRGGLYVATVQHYHGEALTEEAPEPSSVPLPPRVKK